MSVSTSRRTTGVLNADEFRRLIAEQTGNFQSGIPAIGNANTNWQDEVLRTTVSSDYNLSVGGHIKYCLTVYRQLLQIKTVS